MTLFCVTLAGFGGTVAVRPGADVNAAVAQACATPGPREVVLAAGNHYLKSPLALGTAHSNLVVRGEGADKTRLIGGLAVNG